MGEGLRSESVSSSVNLGQKELAPRVPFMESMNIRETARKTVWLEGVNGGRREERREEGDGGRSSRPLWPVVS